MPFRVVKDKYRNKSHLISASSSPRYHLPKASYFLEYSAATRMSTLLSSKWSLFTWPSSRRSYYKFSLIALSLHRLINNNSLTWSIARFTQKRKTRNKQNSKISNEKNPRKDLGLSRLMFDWTNRRNKSLRRNKIEIWGVLATFAVVLRNDGIFDNWYFLCSSIFILFTNLNSINILQSTTRES
jgi:hypothetical protein